MTKQKKDAEQEPEARRLRRELFDDDMLDKLMATTDERGLSLTGEGGFLPEMIRAVLERGMEAELSDHLGYEKGDRTGHGSGNSRKTVGTEVGEVALEQPRDRNSGFSEAIEATWSGALVQTCVVHLGAPPSAQREGESGPRCGSSPAPTARPSRRCCARSLPLRPSAAGGTPSAANKDAALMALTTFADSKLGKKYPAAVATWENAWERFIPFLAFGPALRKVIPPKAPGKLVEGPVIQGWKAALGELALIYPDRINAYL